MKIGLLLPALLMAKRYSDRIFAPKDLFLSLADGLVDRGHKVFVYSTSDTQTKATLISGPKVFEKENLASVRVRTEHEEYTLFKLNYTEYEIDLTVKAYDHARKSQLDIIHSYHDSLAHYVAQLSPIPTVYTLHDPSFSASTLEGWRFDRFKEDKYIAISRRQAEIFRNRLNIFDVVYHGLPVDTWDFSTGKSDKYLAFVGRIIPEKGADDALHVSETLNIPLHMATSGNYLDTPYFKESIAPRLQNHLVTFTGYLDQKTRNHWLKNAQTLIFPIKWEEPFGMVMIEAMACGTPVIAYNRGSVAEIVKDGVTGFIVNPPEADLVRSSQFAVRSNNWIIKKRGIEGLVEAVQRIGEIDRAACRRHVEENFTVEKMVAEHEKVYQNILKVYKKI